MLFLFFVSPKFCICLAIILLQLQWQTVLSAVFDYAINVCENVSDYIFIQNIEDCSRYFVCIDGQAIAQQCRTGLYFDANRQACVATRNVCLQCPKHKKTNLPLLKTCDKYVSCYYGNIYLRKCEDQQQFNGIIGKCDAAKNVDCVDNRCSVHVLDNNATYVTSAAKCEKYFMCQEGKMKALTCGKGLYFSTKCNCCDLKDNVECLIEEVTETKLINVKEKRISQESLMEKLHLPTILSSNVNIKCPTTGSFIYPYHGNSDYYYTCINGQASLRACAKGYQYNVTQRRCVKPKLEEDNDMADFELKVPVEEVELFEVNCPLEGATIMAHSESKEKYILCMNGQPTVFDCAEGLFYNDKLKKCSEFVGDIGIYHAALPGETNNIMCPKFGMFKYPHANDTHYYLCTDGKVYILACDNNEIFDSEINICREKSETDMKRTETATNDENITDKSRATIVAEFASNIICPKLGTFMFPHSQRNRYYVCVDGHAIGFACAEGYIYDSVVNACKADSQTLPAEVPAPTLLDEPVNVLCPSSGASKFPHLARDKFYLCINGMASVLACPQGSLFDAELSNCRTHLEQEQEDVDSKVHTTTIVTLTCPKLGTFVYAHTNKTQYNVCLDGQSIVLTCNEGLIFDPKEKICRTPNENKVENIKVLVDLKTTPTEILNTAERDNNSSVELKAIPTEYADATETHTPDGTEVNKSIEIESSNINKIAQNSKVEDLEGLVDLKAIPAEDIKTVDTLEVSEILEADSLVSDGDNNSEIHKQHNEVIYAIEHNSNNFATTDEVDQSAVAENI